MNRLNRTARKSLIIQIIPKEEYTMRSKRIVLHDEEKLSRVNPETISILQKFKVDMTMRNLSPRTR